MDSKYVKTGYQYSGMPSVPQVMPSVWRTVLYRQYLSCYKRQRPVLICKPLFSCMGEKMRDTVYSTCIISPNPKVTVSMIHIPPNVSYSVTSDTESIAPKCWADSSFAPSHLETDLLYNDVSHWKTWNQHSYAIFPEFAPTISDRDTGYLWHH